MNETAYCNALEKYLHLFVSRSVKENIHTELQQENASFRAAKLTKDLFQFGLVPNMVWFAKSLDLDPIKKLWYEPARMVYKDGRQYYTVDELKETFLATWKKIIDKHIESLTGSMTNHYIKVFQRNCRRPEY